MKHIILLLLVFILCILINKLKNTESFTNYNPTISLCIPCFPRDTPKLEKLLHSVNKQTVKPDEIIIGHSEMNENQAKELEKKYSDLKIKVMSTEK